MKTILTALLMFSLTAAAAEGTDICARFMPCGTYVHAADKTNPKSAETKITITSTGPMQGEFDYTMTTQDGKVVTWPLAATFGEDGRAVLLWEGKEIYATAICALKMCNYALVPFQDQKEIWGNAGLMRFTDTALEFMMVVGQPLTSQSTAMTLTKQ